MTNAPTDPDRRPEDPGAGWHKGWLLPVLIGIAVLAALAAWGILGRRHAVASLRRTADAASLPKVELVSPARGPSSRGFSLPGETRAWYRAPIYAQVTGYVRAWYKDYGAAVRKGDLLATIETPDLDQQLLQARAQLDVAKTRAQVAKVTAERWRKLSGTQAVSQQAVDVNVADAKAAAAEVEAASYNVERYAAQAAFKRVVAPFDGVVTARDTDVGSFVNSAGGSTGSGGRTQPMFAVSDIHALRVFVQVPQDYSGSIVPGRAVSLTLPQFPGRTFEAKFLTSAKSYDTAARTVVTELALPNPDRDIFPGAFAQVRFTVPTDPNVLVVPEQSLLFRAEGLQAAVVRNGKVHLQDVKVGLNFGQTVQVTAGLRPTDRIVANPSAGLLEGESVQPVRVPPQDADTEDAVGAEPERSGTGPREAPGR